jgi:hypothetical protein
MDGLIALLALLVLGVGGMLLGVFIIMATLKWFLRL